jgi:isocitrate dehydrogenase
LKTEFEPIAAKLAENEQAITSELVARAGQSNEIGGYYLPDSEKAAKVMRPSSTFNEIIDGQL